MSQFPYIFYCHDLFLFYLLFSFSTQMNTSFTITITYSPLMIFMVLALWFNAIINIIFLLTFTIYIYTITRGWRGRRLESCPDNPPVWNPSLRELVSPPMIPPPQYQEWWGLSPYANGPMSHNYNWNQGTCTHLTTTLQQHPHQPTGNHTCRENAHTTPNQAEYIEVLRHH